MSLFVQETKTYLAAPDAVYQAAIGAVSGLGGKLAAQDSEARTLTVKFDKKILGRVLGDRTHVSVVVGAAENEPTTVRVEAYPLDAVGQRLLFGARKGVTETVVSWLFAHLEHRLTQSS
jgi:hypothetical protein